MDREPTNYAMFWLKWLCFSWALVVFGLLAVSAAFSAFLGWPFFATLRHFGILMSWMPVFAVISGIFVFRATRTSSTTVDAENIDGMVKDFVARLSAYGFAPSVREDKLVVFKPRFPHSIFYAPLTVTLEGNKGVLVGPAGYLRYLEKPYKRQ